MEDEQRKRIFENQIKNIINSDKILDKNKSILLEFLKFKQWGLHSVESAYNLII